MAVITKLILCCALVVSLVCSSSAIVKRTCEKDTLFLHCPSGDVIRVNRANYGRTAGRAICPDKSIKTHYCYASSSFNIVHNHCDGRAACFVRATNSVFRGDPCKGTYKYLEVDYTCQRRAKGPATHVCERNTVSLSCPSGQKILVLDAFYGRMAGQEICPNSKISNRNCRASSSLGIVEARCNGRSSCTLAANNRVFGDPCRGTYKYLEVIFKCA